MAVTIAASSSTHFLWNGNPMPRVYRVGPFGSSDAILTDPNAPGWLVVPLDSTVGGSVRADQAALIEALTAIVSVPAGAGGGGGAVDPVAIGAAVNAAIRGGGALPVPAAPPTNPIDVTVTNTWAALPSTACTRFELLNERWPVDEIPIRYRRGSGGAARVQPAGKADTIEVTANANEIQVSRADGLTANLVIQLQVLA